MNSPQPNPASIRKIRIARRDPDYALLKKPPDMDVSDSIFDAIAERFPAYQRLGKYINLERPLGHPDLDELLVFAQELGATLQRDKSDGRPQVGIIDYAVYGAAEIDSACLVECEMQGSANVRPFYEADGSINFRVIIDGYLKRCRKADFIAGGNLYHLILVRGKTRELLQSAGLRGFRLIELATDAPDGGWPEDIAPFHLLWSDIEMPPAENILFDNDGKTFVSAGNRDPFPRGCYLLDGHEINPALIYKKDALPEPLPDVALSYERLGGPQVFFSKLFYSQRARRILEEAGMELKLRPVKLT